MLPAWKLLAHLRLHTQLLIATLLIICALLGSLLVIVDYLVRSGIVSGVQESTEASLHTFENVQQERDLELSRTTALLAELPTLKAVMATQHSLTIQVASEPFFKLAGSQLFLLSSPDGEVFGFHVSQPGLNAKLAQLNLKESLDQAENTAWWYGNGQLYRVFLSGIFAGSGETQRQIGIVALGYQIDGRRIGSLEVA